MVIPPKQATTTFVRSRGAMQEKYLAEIVNRFQVPRVRIPLLSRAVKGLSMLAELCGELYEEKVVA